MKKYPIQFLQEMPKSDLHLHLDGSMRIPTLIEMSKKLNVNLPSQTEAGLRELVFKDSYANLGEYLHGFQYTCSALRDLENIERVCYELAIDNQNENVNYIEVRFAPQLLMDIPRGLTFEAVMNATYNGFERAKKEYNNKADIKNGIKPEFNYGIITCAMRMFGKKGFSPFYTELFNMLSYSKEMEVITQASLQMVKAAVKLRDDKGIPIVGIDLAGQEEGYPPHRFKETYQYAHKHFMHKTVHAGEAYGAESIFQAITDLHADRIGHGYYLFDADKVVDPSITDKKKYINDLASYVADKRVVIEVCLTSNLQTNPEIKTVKNHKVKNMMDHRMAISICTDNRLVSNTNIAKEYDLLLENFDIPYRRLKDIVAYGFKKSFHSGTYVEKRDYAKKCMQYFDQIALKHKIKMD